MRIVILSRNKTLYSTRSQEEAAKARGHEVLVVDHLKCYMGIEEDRPTVHYQGEQLPPIHAVIPRIGASVTSYGSAIVRQFEMMSVFCANKSQAIVRSRDKLRSLQILSRRGVGIPRTVFANKATDTDQLLKLVDGPPVVIKLLSGTQGIGVVLAETKKAAKSVIEAFYGLKEDILVQEFIEEAQGADIRAFVVDGQVVGAIKRQGKEGDFRSNLHRGGLGTPVKLKRKEKTAALRAARAMGLSIAGVDMLLSDRGPLILEVNASPGLKGMESITGIDVATHIIRFVEENAPKKKTRDRVGV